jgi:hypothetical protein
VALSKALLRIRSLRLLVLLYFKPPSCPCEPRTKLQNGLAILGVVVAVRGSAAPGGDFHVSGILFPGMGPQAAPPPAPRPGQPPKYVALVSGLAVGGDAVDSLKLQLLVDFLNGNLGGPAMQKEASQVCVCVGGGCLWGCHALSALQLWNPNFK